MIIFHLGLRHFLFTKIFVQGNPRNSGFEHHVALYVPVSTEKKKHFVKRVT